MKVTETYLARLNLTIGKRTGRIRNQKNNRNHWNYSIIMIGQNTQKSSRDLAVTKSFAKNH